MGFLGAYDENADYNRYNLEIVEHLKQQKSAVNKHPIFNKYDLDEAIDCYQMVADSIRDNELLIRWFRCVKP